MQRANFSIRGLLAVVAAGLLVTGFLAACNKDLDNDNATVPSAGLMVFNLAVDKAPIGVALSGNAISNAPLDYTAYNGGYQRIYTGSRDIEAYDFTNDSVFSKSNFSFQDSSVYSVFVMGNNGSYHNVTVKDNVDSAASDDQAYIRYVNAIPDSSAPRVSIQAAGSEVSGESAAFGQVSAFIPVAAGDVTIAVSNDDNVLANRTITLESGRAYTALLVGTPDATDTAKKVQIRYIENGTVNNTTSAGK
jgi:hypothetical protein